MRKDSVYRLVTNGKSHCILVERADGFGADAAEDLRRAIRKSSGVDIPTTESEEWTANASRCNLVILFVQGKELEGYGVPSEPLAQEAYRIVTQGDRLFFCADTEIALMYAVSDFLDRHVGVLWLWPGELGTFVPKRDTIELSAMDKTTRPALEHRRLRSARHSPEVARWNTAHRM
ncbi:MAG: hypothetical protein K0R67_3918, partial [Paenibacillus sp.]|nr:hypothetical protein [Paenibacillus sp.]